MNTKTQTQIDLSKLKSDTEAKVAQASSQQQEQVAPQVASAPKLVPAKVVLYQSYISSLENQRIAMDNGKLISITAYKYITAAKDEVAFLNKLIEEGSPYISYEGELTSEDLDPMAALRKRILQEAIDAGVVQVPNPTLGNTDTQRVVPADTKSLGAVAAGSSSSEG